MDIAHFGGGPLPPDPPTSGNVRIHYVHYQRPDKKMTMQSLARRVRRIEKALGCAPYNQLLCS